MYGSVHLREVALLGGDSSELPTHGVEYRSEVGSVKKEKAPEVVNLLGDRGVVDQLGSRSISMVYPALRRRRHGRSRDCLQVGEEHFFAREFQRSQLRRHHRGCRATGFGKRR